MASLGTWNDIQSPYCGLSDAARAGPLWLLYHLPPTSPGFSLSDNLSRIFTCLVPSNPSGVHSNVTSSLPPREVAPSPIIFFLTVLNCFLGKNFINITYISGNGGAGVLHLLQAAWQEPPIKWWNLWHFPQVYRLLRPADVSPCISLCLWTGLVIHWLSGFLLIVLQNGSMKITAKNL